ncbi:histone-lysine N-methyltransferase ash1 isoform X2 [Orussus abietinus]|uniref:histone-lysine N-methyltransferase ash1 isoform X2 n=1 Tax=Orussus abietinus TaxID=222816 RepID=UPI0006255970|nr:histone-lysine N-methyltransferase ash1 isoform X2 [Orussus abietinus]
MSGDSGWSSVIPHHSELELQNWNWDENDGELERELPSTVDMEAIKGGGSWDPASGPHGTDSMDSEQDSDSEDESSGGSDGSCSYSDSNSESEDESSGEEGEDSGSNSDCTSEHSEQTFSIQETNFEQGALKLKITMKAPKKEEMEKPKCDKGRRVLSRRTKAVNRSAKTSEGSSEESDSSGSNPSSQNLQQPLAPQQQQTQPSQQQQQQPLQEINQEDLAAILPDQEHEDAPFDGFEDSESGRIVSRAIERMSLGADSDTSENADQNPVPVYSSTLLQQFVEKTALLSEPRKRRNSGIQSVDNSPLHLGVNPASPPAAVQSPIQVAPPKPAVNVDRVLYPPKRKPGRPAKGVSTQPRGPGRPRLKPEIAQKIEKIENELNDSPATDKPAKEDASNEKLKNEKLNSSQVKPQAKLEMKQDTTVRSKNLKSKKSCQKKKYSPVKTLQEKPSSKKDKLSPTREKCLNKSAPTKHTKVLTRCDGRACKKRQDKSYTSKGIASPCRQRSADKVSSEERIVSNTKKSSKENRIDPSVLCKKQSTLKKSAPQSSRRVLKENKSSKRSTTELETNGVGVQTMISMPIEGDALKSELSDNVFGKANKAVQSMHNHCHKHHHHKHRRRLIPPKTPIRVDPCIVEELEKLIEEFSKSCSLGRYSANSGHSELPQIFRVKKMTKKRKGGDVSINDEQKLKRRLKKEKAPLNIDSKSNTNTSTSSNSNEQRLPLKKRHYHVSSPHSSQSSNASCTDTNANESNSTESHIEEAIEATITRYGGSSGGNSQHKDAIPVTPKKRHRDADSATPEKLGNESCDSMDDKPLNQLEIQPRRKKKILRDLRVTVTKLSASENQTSADKGEKSEKAVFDKNLKTSGEKTGKAEKASLEKSVKVDKSQSKKALKSDSSTDNPRSERNASNLDAASSTAASSDSNESIKDTKISSIDLNMNVPNPVNPLAALILTKKKIRRRKTINRTGFPTTKKKKKKSSPDVSLSMDTKLSKSTIIAQAAKFRDSSLEKLKNDAKTEDKAEFLESTQTQEKVSVSPTIEDSDIRDANEEAITDQIDVKDYDDSNSPKPELSRHSYSEDVLESYPGQLRVRKDLVECDGSQPCDKLCPVKYEKIQDSRMYDENATLEESLERYNQSQRVAELNEENLRKLERANSQDNVKMELSSNINNNHGHKRRRGSASPCNLTLRSLKRLRNAGYDTESDALPSSDIASDDHEVGRNVSLTHGRRKQPRWKKRYLQAGLFSDYFKEDEPRKISNSDNGSGKNKLAYDPAEHPHGLLPPPYHCGKFLRQRKIPFQLPYDLWWLHTHSRLPGRDLVPSWNYRKIRTNIYYDVKPTTLYEAQACECKPESGCGDDCINRMVFSECSPQLCPCGEKCENQKIQKHEWAPGLQRFMTENKGWGVKTQLSIKSGDFILEYVGEVVSEREFKSRMATRYASDTHHYCLHLDGGLVIDGHRMGGDGRFVNHSCEPNCEMQKWSVHGLPRMALFALRDIHSGEELTYDYNFALFNPSEGQQCRCGSNACRGVIGGKSQRVSRSLLPAPPQLEPPTERRSVGRPRKNVRKSNIVQSSNSKGLCKSRKVGDPTLINTPLIKPMSHQQRCFAQQHHCFLLRNLEKVRRLKSSVSQVQTQPGKTKVSSVQATKEKSAGDSTLFSQLTALTNTNARTVRTRRLAQAQDDPEVNKTAKLAKVLKDLYTVVTTANDENSQLLCTPFMNLPPKRKLPEYYDKIQDPIDLMTIDQCIGTGHYKTAELFDQDMIKLFDNNVKFFGRTSEVGIAAARLRKLYLSSKPDFIDAITEATGIPPSQGFLPPRGSTAGEEDVIRCICGLHRDEGLMIQCERCLVWQHCDCVKADTSVESYLCERCQPRTVDLEIPLEGEEEEEGKKHYVTLLRGDLQLRQGDTVYVLRDTPEKHTYKTIQKPDYEQMDIFRIERLWKNPEGERFVFGHHYLRPHETYHEPTRKFYENEVVCAPLYEAVPCDLVAERCWVLDPHTFCKGRPVGATPEHTYVCEYRVDRAARLFTKVARARHQVCTKPYAFEAFPERIKHYRTYLPHSLEGIQASGKLLKDKKKHNSQEEHNHKVESTESSKLNGKDQLKTSNGRTRRRSSESLSAYAPSTICVQREEQKRRLNRILIDLLQRMPNKKDPLDLSFLLDRNRRNRKRPGGLNP